MDWYDEFLTSIGVDPSTTDAWSNASSPSNQQILDDMQYTRNPLEFFSDLLKGTTSFGKAGQLAGIAGLGSLMNNLVGSSGGGQYAGYQGGIPSYTASRTMLPIPATVPAPTAENPEAVAPRRPGSGGVTYFTPMQYTKNAAAGGIMSLPRYNLGGYSDGGRLLRGPGDGVSDDIPATIGDRQPARLADGEFVIPARIVSELGNGSTESGARKLYAMMDRVQKRRQKTVGKGKVAVDSGAHKEVDKL